MLEIRNVRKAYDGKPALDGFSLTVKPGEYLSMLGPSGSGKSTLLRIVAGFERPDAGVVFLNGRALSAVPAHERGIGYVSQGFALFPHMTVFDNVAFGLRYRQQDRLRGEADIRARVDHMLELVGLVGLGGRQIGQISGGQKQRVALARTLVVDPKVCLLDEPLGALDANLRQRMTIELRRIHQRLGIMFIHVTGNEMEALAMGDRVVVLDAGRAIQVADPDTVYNRPANVQVTRFLNRYNIFSGAVANGRFMQAETALPLPEGTGSLGGAASYCIRRDKIQVLPADHGTAPGEATIGATFVASEYSGAVIVYLFKLAGGQVIEVEYHLSHKRPETFREGGSYALVWPAEQALLFGPADLAA